MSIEKIKETLEGCPEDPGQIAEGLVGWKWDSKTVVCSRCAGRLVMRGCSHLLYGAKPMWADEIRKSLEDGLPAIRGPYRVGFTCSACSQERLITHISKATKAKLVEE